MPDRLWFGYALWMALVVSIGGGSAVAQDALMDMQAVRLEGAGTISSDGKTVTLTELPADIQIDVFLSGWGAFGDTFGYNCQWDCASYANGSANELAPNGEFCVDFATEVCQGVDVSRADYILRDAATSLPICNNTRGCPDGSVRRFSCGAAWIAPPLAGAPDTGVAAYGATLSLHVPCGASGTYNPTIDVPGSTWQHPDGDVPFDASGITVVVQDDRCCDCDADADCDDGDGCTIDTCGGGNGCTCVHTIGPLCIDPIGCRYFAITPPPGPEPIALLVTGDAGDPAVSCVSQYVQPDGTLGAAPAFQTPSAWGTVAVHGIEVLPDTRYSVRVDDGTTLSGPMPASTLVWGDANADGLPTIADILQVIQGFQNNFANAPIEAVDMEPCHPNGAANFGDVLIAVMAQQGLSYAATGCTAPCP